MDEITRSLASIVKAIPTSALWCGVLGAFLLFAALVTRLGLTFKGWKITADVSSRLHGDRPVIILVAGTTGLSLIMVAAILGVLPPNAPLFTAHTLIASAAFIALATAAYLLWTKKRQIAKDYFEFLEPFIPRLVFASLNPNSTLRMTMAFILKCCELSRDRGDVSAMLYAFPGPISDNEKPKLTQLYCSENVSQEVRGLPTSHTLAQGVFEKLVTQIRHNEVPEQTDEALNRYYFYMDLEKKPQDGIVEIFPGETRNIYKDAKVKGVWGIPIFYVKKPTDPKKPMSSLEIITNKPMGIITFASTFSLTEKEKQHVRSYSLVQSRILGALFNHHEGLLRESTEPLVGTRESEAGNGLPETKVK